MSVPTTNRRPLDINLLLVVEPTSEAERTTHQAACHCGAVQFAVTLKWPFPKYPVNTCSCSICTQNGYLFVYPCRRDVVFTKGELLPTIHTLTSCLHVSIGYDNLGSHSFNSMKTLHKFCKTCGGSLLADFDRISQGDTDDPARDMIAVNVSLSHFCSSSQEHVLEKCWMTMYLYVNVQQVRTFKDLDLDALEYTYFDGRKHL